ncbi:MAG: hypothetical protein Fur0041_18610 [Bacteroidia bacterium]
MKRLVLLYGLFFLPLLTGLQVTPRADANARIKSVFIYNFTRYIEWPSDYKSGNFIISIFGSNTALLNELNNMAKTKTVGEQKIEIRNTTSLDGIGKSNILFVTPDAGVSLSEVIAKLKGKSTLLVTEKAGYAKQGAAINFVVIENRQKFELNKANAEKYNLKVSSTLESLAIPVN